MSLQQQNSSQKKKPITLFENIEMKGSPNVFLSELVWDKIQFLCSKINKVEWSGCIFYKFILPEATLVNPSSCDIEIVDMIPLDKGSVGFTEYNFDSRVLNYLVEKDYLDLKIGHLHSHHSMKSFFSGTDMSELNENSEFIKPYLSLIVNNNAEFACKLAFRVQHTPVTYSYQDINNNELKFTLKEDNKVKVASYDCKVVIPEKPLTMPEDFMNQFNEIMKPKPMYKMPANGKVPVYTGTKGGNINPNYAKTFEQQREALELDLDLEWDTPVYNYGRNYSFKEIEDLTCYVLRLGQAIPGDDIEKVLEDMEQAFIDSNFDLEKYIEQLKKNLNLYFSRFFDKTLTKKDEDELTELFVDELIFQNSSFPFLEEIIDNLIIDNLDE